jgi:hypothetical protein
VQGRPLQNQCERPPWQFAAKHGKRRYLDRSFLFAVNGMEMRWLVIVVVEPNGNSEESGNFRHLHSNCIQLLACWREPVA